MWQLNMLQEKEAGGCINPCHRTQSATRREQRQQESTRCREHGLLPETFEHFEDMYTQILL